MEKVKSVIRDLAIAVLIALFIRTFLFQAYRIPTASMVPTLLVGDHIIVSRSAYGIRIPYYGYIVRWGDVKRGDVIVFEYPVDRSRNFIKRVIAVGGETVEIRNKRVYINGRRLEDPWGFFSDIGTLEHRDNWGPKRVPPGYVFVLGDNRDESSDSRFWGFVPERNIKGKALFIYFSFDPKTKKLRKERIFSAVR